MSIDAILKEIENLSAADRAELQARLAERFPDGDAGIPPEIARLLDERDAAYEANPDAGYTIEEVIAYVKRQK